MVFRELNLNIEYNSEITDVARNFFIPVLKESKSYKRVSAYYSSNSLKLIAEGLSAMINNDGTMNLLVSYLVSKEDIDDETKLKELMVDKNVLALGYLIAAKRIDIKFVICKGKGIFHLKFGIFTDDIGDRISFSGSINETYEGLTDNIEEFKVFRSWFSEEQKYLDGDSDSFDRYWHGKINRKDYLIVDMPEKLKNIIIRVYQESENQSKQFTKKLHKLWPHQS